MPLQTLFLAIFDMILFRIVDEAAPGTHTQPSSRSLNHLATLPHIHRLTYSCTHCECVDFMNVWFGDG